MNNSEKEGGTSLLLLGKGYISNTCTHNTNIYYKVQA